MLKFYLFGGISMGGLVFAIAMSRGRSIGTSALVATVVGMLVVLLLISAVETGRSSAREREKRLGGPLAELVKTLRTRGFSVDVGENSTLTIRDTETEKSFTLAVDDIVEHTQA